MSETDKVSETMQTKAMAMTQEHRGRYWHGNTSGKDDEYAVPTPSVCVCDSSPHVIYTNKDENLVNNEYKTLEKSQIGQYFGVGVAEAGQTCHAVCDNRFNKAGQVVQSAREIFDQGQDVEAKQMGYTGASDEGFQQFSRNTLYEDICGCDLKFDSEMGKLKLFGEAQSFKDTGLRTDDYELRTNAYQMELGGAEIGEEKIYATIPKGYKGTTCETQCARVAGIQSKLAVRDSTAEFRGATGYAAPSDGENGGMELSKAFKVMEKTG